jgi:hypothetical protein
MFSRPSLPNLYSPQQCSPQYYQNSQLPKLFSSSQCRHSPGWLSR